MKERICAALGAAGGIIAAAFGGWDTGLQGLILLMMVDYTTGLMVAGIFHASPKTPNGRLESRAGWKGLCRKFTTLLMVLLASRMDLILGICYVRDAVIIGLCANESLSILENAGLMGLPIPKALENAIELLTQRSEQEDTGNG